MIEVDDIDIENYLHLRENEHWKKSNWKSAYDGNKGGFYLLAVIIKFAIPWPIIPHANPTDPYRTPWKAF